MKISTINASLRQVFFTFLFSSLCYSVNSQVTYCVPTYLDDCSDGNNINDFLLNGDNGTKIQDQNTGCSPGGYDDKSAQPAVKLSAGQTYTAKISSSIAPDVQPIFGGSGMNVAIWIDFDDDGTFDPGDKVGEFTTDFLDVTTTDVPITIPQNANEGTHRMRVVGALAVIMMGQNPYGGEINPCPDANGAVPDPTNPNPNPSFDMGGEVHDYSVQIGEGTSTNNCNNFTANLPTDTTICSNASLLLDATIAGATSYSWNDNSSSATKMITAAGQYSVHVTDGTCDFDATINVAVANLPTASNIIVTNNGNGNYSFSVNGASDVTNYSWDFGDNTTGNGATVTHTYTGDGDYIVTLNYSNNCGYNILTNTVNYSTAGLSNNTTTEIKVYPNPAKDVLVLSNLDNMNVQQISLINVLGQTVYNQQISKSQETIKINLSSLNKGVYILKLTGNQKTFTKKILITK